MHILIARDGDRWGAWTRDASDLPWSSVTIGDRLQPVAEAGIEILSAETALTFSSRQHDIVSPEIAETPGGLAAVDSGVRVEMLMPEGRFDGDDRWAVIYRDAKTGRTYSFGASDAFRAQTLRARVHQWFERQPWASFGAPTQNRPETIPPPWQRELYVRPEWRARAICPGDFPEFKPWPVSQTQAAHQ
jgi:hypothetical protein